MSGATRVYAGDADLLYPTEFLPTADLSHLPDQKISLKVWCAYDGLCNGTPFMVTRL